MVIHADQIFIEATEQLHVSTYDDLYQYCLLEYDMQYWSKLPVISLKPMHIHCTYDCMYMYKLN